MTVRFCVRDKEGKNGDLPDREETQTDMGNKCSEAVHFLFKYQILKKKVWGIQSDGTHEVKPLYYLFAQG